MTNLSHQSNQQQQQQQQRSNSSRSSISPAVSTEQGTTTPLDLSRTSPVAKRIRIDSPNQSNRTLNSEKGGNENSIQYTPPIILPRCQAQSDVNSWNVEQVCDFVGGVDICAEYVQVSNDSFYYYL